MSGCRHWMVRKRNVHYSSPTVQERLGMHISTPSCSWNKLAFRYYSQRSFWGGIRSMLAVGESYLNAPMHNISLWRENMQPWHSSVSRKMHRRFSGCRNLLATIRLWPRWRRNGKEKNEV